MRALFESIPLDPGEDVLLLYRARTEGELIFRGELEEIALRRGTRLRYVLGEGRDALSPAAFQRMVPDLAERDVYVCGPPGLMTAVRTSLNSAGLPSHQLHEERFSF
jgi:ferredoxin-NADP reductase